MIHPSHSKKDLIEVVERFQLYQIEDYRSHRKERLALYVWIALQDISYVVPDDEYFFVSDITELRSYLTTICVKQITSNSVKYDVCDRVKNLNFYIKGGFAFEGTNYESIDAVVSDADFVRNFGDLPSVRKALLNLGEDPKMPMKLYPVMTRRVQQRLIKNTEIKRQNTPKFHTRIGHYTIDFT